MVDKIKFDWKKSLMKAVKIGLPVLGAGIAAVYGESQWFLALVPLWASISNVLKHKYGIDLRIV